MKHQIDELILQKLSQLLSSFRERRQVHFAERYYRITKDISHNKILFTFAKNILDNFQNDLDIVCDSTRVKNEGLAKIKFLTNENPGKNERWQYYKNIPELKYYQELVYKLVKVNDYNMVGSNKLFDELKHKLKDVEWESKLLDQELIHFDPVQTTNLVYWLRELQITDVVDEFIKLLLCEYPLNLKNTEKTYVKNQLYAYTHILISESLYYQKYLENDSLNLAKFLSSNLDQIMKACGIDLKLEFGVVFKLFGNSYDRNVQKIKIALENDFDKEKGLFPTKSESQSAVEHANTLGFMLYHDWKDLHPGPDLSNDLK